MTNEERARELSEKLEANIDINLVHKAGILRGTIDVVGLGNIKDAFDAVERETLERAAMECDANAAEAERDRVSSGDVAIRACALWSRQSFEQNAKNIRALVGQPQEPTPITAMFPDGTRRQIGTGYEPGIVTTENAGAIILELQERISELQTPSEPTPDLTAIILECAAQFDFYVDQHLAKNPPDEAKASTNREFAKRCRAALRMAEDGR